MRLIFTTVFVISSLFIFSQGFDAYFIAGLQGSQIDGDGMGGYNKAGIKLGPAVVIPGEKMDFNMELTYSLEGSRSTLNPQPNTINFTLQYIDLALLGSKEFYPNFIVYFGGQIGYYLKGETNSSGSITDFDAVMRRFDIPYEIGLGYKINESLEFVIKQSRSILTTRNDRQPFRNNNLGVYLKLNF